MALTTAKSVSSSRKAAIAAIRKPQAASRLKVDAAVEAPPAGLDTPFGPGMLSTTGSTISTTSLLFDPDWYLSENSDVAEALLDPVGHYLENGAREGRNPNAEFDTTWYLANNADVVTSQLNPFLHYVLYGAREGRQPNGGR